jgi:cobalt/nickel transport system permease protein
MRLSVEALHIPDGFLSLPVALIGWLLAMIFIFAAIRQTRDQMGERQIPLMGVLAAFIFAAQAINFPVAGGTSGHLLGGTLAAIVVGPWAGTLIMTAVIVVQGLLFQDGGLLVMGWNIVNMGVITAFSGYTVYLLVLRVMKGRRGARIAGAFTGGWLSVLMAAVATSLELAASGTSPLGVVLPAMAGVHMLIGIGEGVISAGAVTVIQTSRPEVLEAGELAPGRGGAMFTAAVFGAALLLALLAPLASPAPDGLERVAGEFGFFGFSQAPGFSIFPDYALPFVRDDALTTILAVVTGTVIVCATAWALARAIRSRARAGE